MVDERTDKLIEALEDNLDLTDALWNERQVVWQHEMELLRSRLAKREEALAETRRMLDQLMAAAEKTAADLDQWKSRAGDAERDMHTYADAYREMEANLIAERERNQRLRGEVKSLRAARKKK